MAHIKDSYQLQSIVKGFANHYRIDLLRLAASNPDISVEEMSEILKANYKTISVHVRQLHGAGLISKKYLKSSVQHRITRRGLLVLKFLGKLE